MTALPLNAIPEVVSATEANRNFSRLLREVGVGRSFVVTSHGRPVARLAPIEPKTDLRAPAQAALWEHLRSVKAVDPPIGPWTRDELHDD